MDMIEYVRSPLVPVDQASQIIYLIDELDKIAFTIQNLQYEIDQRLTALEGP